VGAKIIVQGDAQFLVYVYGRETKADADIARLLTTDEARSNIAKLPKLLCKD